MADSTPTSPATITLQCDSDDPERGARGLEPIAAIMVRVLAAAHKRMQEAVARRGDAS